MNSDTQGEIIPALNLNTKATIWSNLPKGYILIHDNSLELYLMKNQRIINIKNQWKIFVGLLATLFITLCTATFKPTFGIDATMWKALFMVSTFICIGLTLYYGYFAIINREKGSVEQLIDKIKKESAKETRHIKI